MSKYITIIFLSFFFAIQNTFAQTDSFPYHQRAWATYMAPINISQFDNQGAQIFYGYDGYYSYETNPFDSLAPYIINPDYESYYYLGKLNPDQTIAFLKKVGQARSLDTLLYNYIGGLKTVGQDGNIYFTGITQASEGVATPGAYQNNFSENWSDPYEVYYPDFDVTVTIEPELCKDAFIEKYNAEGEKIWGSYYNGNQDMRSVSLLEQSGYLYLWGLTTSYEGIATPGTYISEWGDNIPHHIYRPFVMKIDKDSGNILWGTYLDSQSGENTANYIGNHFTANSNGYCFYFNSDGGLTILDENGTLSLIDSSPVVSYQNILHMKGDDLGNIYITGGASENDSIGTSESFRPTKSYLTQSYILKLNQSGERLWGTYLFNRDLGVPYGKMGICFDKSAVYIVSFTEEDSLATPSAYQVENAGGQNDLVFMKLDAFNGSLKWLSYYGGNASEQALGTVSPKIWLDTNDNLYIAASSNSDPSAIVSENALFKWPINEDKSFTVKFIHEKNLAIKDVKISDVKLYPNPTTQSITLKTEKLFPKETKFSIYDLLGQRLKNMEYNHQSTQKIDVSNLSPGVYFLKIQNKTINQSLKFIKK